MTAASPHLVDQLGMRHYLAAAPGQCEQQAELRWCEIERTAAALSAVAAGIDLDSADTIRLSFRQRHIP